MLWTRTVPGFHAQSTRALKRMLRLEWWPFGLKFHLKGLNPFAQDAGAEDRTSSILSLSFALLKARRDSSLKF